MAPGPHTNMWGKGATLPEAEGWGHRRRRRLLFQSHIKENFKKLKPGVASTPPVLSVVVCL